jgi:hypothetical protein
VWILASFVAFPEEDVPNLARIQADVGMLRPPDLARAAIRGSQELHPVVAVPDLEPVAIAD